MNANLNANDARTTDDPQPLEANWDFAAQKKMFAELKYTHRGAGIGRLPADWTAQKDEQWFAAAYLKLNYPDVAESREFCSEWASAIHPEEWAGKTRYTQHNPVVKVIGRLAEYGIMPGGTSKPRDMTTWSPSGRILITVAAALEAGFVTEKDMPRPWPFLKD